MMSHHTLFPFGWIKINQGTLSRLLRRGSWKCVNLLVVLAMLLPNFTFFVDQALAAEASAANQGAALKLRPGYLLKHFVQEEGETPTSTPTSRLEPSTTPEPTETVTTTLTTTPTVTPTVTLEPTPTLTPTMTLEPTPEVTPTATIPPMLIPTLEPTVEVTETASGQVELILNANPAFVNPGGQAFIDWEITGLETLIDTQNLELIFWVPAGFAPHKSQKGEFDLYPAKIISTPFGQSDWVKESPKSESLPKIW